MRCYNLDKLAYHMYKYNKFYPNVKKEYEYYMEYNWFLKHKDVYKSYYDEAVKELRKQKLKNICHKN